ncbi:glycosyltransferase [Rhodoferax saidenbachensis]|uniref:GT2 family glycosyltransferase n=1 Tax=Rhodoferax saidenbachensis TaxID=1484693 RepID=A0ABU1ZK75_9BURK|nr:glycosyltransferase [Rhodoferax saidenbachensis]MDR7305275.1 GT2 family glycosyltransferase [Rhodoferax saidenbachensis]
MKPILSLVVLGYRNFKTVTRGCLESLLPWENHPEVEILVVDNGSPDDSADLTRRWCTSHPGFRSLVSAENRGFAGGMNWGASHAQGTWLLLVNNDTVFPPLALDALLRVVQAAPAAVAMLGPVTNAAGNGQRLWKPEASLAQWLQIGETLHAHPTNQLMPAYRCDFFCIAIRRDAWEQLGGLDPAFGLGYYEDFDFSLRLRAVGLEQMITEDVFILHVGSATFKGSKEARALIKRNKKLLQAKHSAARFEHTRLGNLAVLARYEELRRNGLWTPPLQLRAGLRTGALEGDAPRSVLKRWLWRRKVRKVFA